MSGGRSGSSRNTSAIATAKSGAVADRDRSSRRARLADREREQDLRAAGREQPGEQERPRAVRSCCRRRRDERDRERGQQRRERGRRRSSPPRRPSRIATVIAAEERRRGEREDDRRHAAPRPAHEAPEHVGRGRLREHDPGHDHGAARPIRARRGGRRRA